MGSEEFAEAWIFYSKKEENKDMTEKRVLNGYSKDVQVDFKKLSEDYDFPLYEIMEDSFRHLPALQNLIDVIQDEDDDKRLLQDIADYINGKAKFSEQKYYIKMPKVNYPYLIRDMGGKFDHAQSPDILGSGENSFTEQEIKAIDSRYMVFAVPVEADDE
ncbi:DUF1642 domain-containing protein [Companilactobacillus zhachilii]|uniref:DUF1642 domain-containing protein n=1 Tax=Companilactobacillus zhachilii TaxID=2304606 RepID=A0A386PRW9_9LACO|nr:DUF1642 domain-containing protein [Companilactobacillus zhachilii]AYE38704.1 DUF1642 domain-containing protein [Companilactobacillus zhachilii]